HVRPFEELKSDAPAAIAAFNQVHPARWIAAIGIIVAGEEIAVLIERKLLWVAQAVGENFEIGAIWIAAIHGARLGILNTALLRFNTCAAVANAKIQLPVRAKAQAMQVVPNKADTHSVTVVQRFFRIGDAIIVFVLQQPKVRNVGEVHVALAGEDARGNPIRNTIVAL